MIRSNLVGALARHLTLRQLQVFEAVARLGSFTHAAEELYLAQPTVSMQIKKLTDSVGMTLIEQVGLRIKLTETGRELYTTCLEVFHTISNLETKISDLKGIKCGHLNLSVITSAKYLAPNLLGQFSRLHPGINITLKVMNRKQLLERISLHEDDLYILGQPPEQIDVEAYPLVPNPLVVMASRDHPLANAANIPLEKLLSEPFIMREPGSGTRDAILRLFQTNGLKSPVAHMEFASNEAIKQVVGAGLGITVLSLHALALEGIDGPIAVLDVKEFPIQRKWYVVQPKGRKLSIVAQAFLDFVGQEGKNISEKFDLELAKLHASKTKKRRRK